MHTHTHGVIGFYSFKFQYRVHSLAGPLRVPHTFFLEKIIPYPEGYCVPTGVFSPLSSSRRMTRVDWHETLHSQLNSGFSYSANLIFLV